jgi:uncharacterized protein YndB with AHSA1/START domain
MTPERDRHPVVRIERTIAAPPAEVYRAWLDPETLCRWLAPGDLHVTRAEVDERPGGRFRIWQERDDGVPRGGFECELVELVPPERIVFRWGFVGPDRLDGPSFDSRLTISLRDAPGDRTALTLVHEQLDALRAAMPEVADMVAEGWQDVLDALDEALAEQARSEAPTA